MAKESIEIALRYEGPDVNDGTMSIQDIVPVLQGFSSAYGKLAAQDDPGATHRLRIAGVRPGSASIILDVWRVLGENADQIGALAVVGGTGYAIVKKIVQVIRVKRHAAGLPFKERIAVDGAIVISNTESVTVEVPLDVYELFKSGLIDADLSRMVSPLREGHIESAEIEAKPIDGEVLRERIDVADKPLFDVSTTAVTTTRRSWLIAKLNSLTKSTNGGYLYLQDGTRTYYSYLGDNPFALHQLFGSYDGPVRIDCEAHLDESLKIVSVDIFNIERLQGDLLAHLPPPGAPGE